MPRTDSPEATLVDILGTLESKAKDSKERCEAYNKLTRHFRENEASLFGADVSKNIARVLKVIKNDVNSSSHEVKNVALQILGACLYDTDIVSHMKKTDCTGMLKTLCLTIHNTKEKSTCSCALWCLKSQNLDDIVITEKVDEILMAVEYAMEKWSGISVSVVHECVSTIERLNTQAPKEMGDLTLRWGKLLLPLVVHGAVQVREGALSVIEVTLNKLKAVHKDLVGGLKPLFKQQIIPALKAFFKQGLHVYALRCWSIFVQLFGEELHHASYLNEFLPVVELGFKSTEPCVKVAAFQAWRQLIDNFAISQSVIQDPKRIKLVMQVFKHNNARTESVAMEKLTCWWHFLWLLGNKVSPNFDMVAGPLLHFCIGGRQSEQNGGATPKPMKSGTSPVTPHLKLSNAGTHELPVFKSLQLLGCEVLAHFLGNVEADETHHKFKLDPLTHEIVTGPSFFIKHSALLISSAIQLYSSLGKDAPESLVLHSWQWFIAHLQNAMESPAKLDIRETLSTLFLQLQILVQSKALPDAIILKLLDSLRVLPKKIMCSSAYSIGGEEMIHGTPALFVTGLLLAPTLLPTCSGLDSYHDLFSILLANGSGNSTGTLGFLQSVMEILKENAQYVQDKETLWRLWSAVEHPLLQHISKTNEINQGDSLEHDFGCSVHTLVFPVIHDLHELPQSLVKSMIKSWSELYKTVNRLAAMVANAEANIVCEEVCSQVLDHYLEKDTVEATEVDMLVQMCHVVVNCLYFSSLGSQPMFRMLSPKKLAKNRHKPLENIHSVVAMLGLLQKKAVALVKDSESFKKSTGVSIQTVLNNLVETFSTIFVQVTSSNVISNLIGQLARPIGDLLADAQKKTTAKVYNSSFDSKLEKLWLDISTCLQSRYTGLFDTDFLEKCSPLLEATFLHPRRQMKNQTMSLWTCTFGKAAFLSYPELLKPVLSKVKAKSMIQLPNWVATISPVIDETPLSQMTQSQAPEPRIPGMPSPHKVHGSLLNKPVSPRPNRSPVRAATDSPLSAASAKKKKLNLDGFKDGDFVLIKHTPKRKMVLTEHQKEVMKEKSAVPVMYNSLDHSVDASLMAAHFTTDTQMESTMSETPTPTASQPFSLFGSVVPPSITEGKEKEQSKVRGRKPVTNKLESMKAAEKLKRLEDRKNNVDSDLDFGLRRSSRVREHEERDETSEERWTKFRTKKPELSKSPIKSQKKGMKRKAFDNNLIIIDDDDETTDGEFGTEEEPTDNEFLGNDEESTDIDFGTEDDDIGCSEEHTFKGKLEASKTAMEISGSDAGREIDSGGKDSGSSGGGLPDSVPQNVLGAIGFFQSLSSRSGLSKTNTDSSKSSKESHGQDEKMSTDNESEIGDSRTVVSKDVHVEEEKAVTQPLQSWTQKLNELSTSPRPVSPVRKWSSQDSVTSQDRKSRTSKSPKRNKKKPTDENEEKGALEKWIIRSPGKNFQENLNTDIVVANLSQTLVEETQSPTKFANKGMKDKGLSSSIMETPPKNVLENITVSHSNSNRKLFGSQSSNSDYKFVEDSNIVPASPNSKSFRCGTPVLKLKKLTNEEISRYSPSRKNNHESSARHKLSEGNQYEYSDKSKRMINVDGVTSKEGSLQDHDDFSAFTPLEKGPKGTTHDGFFSSQPSDTDKALLKLNENNETDNMTECSGSQNLFSQSEKCSDEKVSGSADELQDMFNDSMEKTHQKSQILDSQDIESMEVTESADNKQVEESKREGPLNVEERSIATPPNVEPEKKGRGRKRKQITPRKLTPEDIKNKNKKEEDVNKVVAKKLSKILKGNKEQSSESEGDTRNPKTKIGKKDSDSQKKGITSQGKPSKKKGKKHNLKKSENDLSNDLVSSPRRSKRNNSGSPNGSTDASSADSSHEELEVGVIEDILDLEEDHHCVKTLTEIRKDLKKNKSKTKVEKDNQHNSEPIKMTEPVKETEVVKPPSPVINLEKALKNKLEDNHAAHTVPNQNSMNTVEEKNGKDMNGNTFVNISTPAYEDISDSEMDVAVDENEEIKESIAVDLPKDTDIAQYDANPLGVDLGAEDVPYLEMGDATPFIAVKLGEGKLPHIMECKTDGTLSSPTADRVDDYLGILIESSDEEKDLPDIQRRFYDDSEDNSQGTLDSQSEAEVNGEKDESFFSDDDVPIAKMTEKVIEKNKNTNKRKKGTLKSKQKVQPSRTRLRSKEMKTECLVQGTKQTTNKGKTIKTDDKIENDEKLAECTENLVEINEIEVQKEVAEKSEEPVEKTKETETELLNVELNNVENIVDETPKKEPDVLKSSVAAMLMMRNSDSKLVLGSRKFEKKSGVVRRSILKPASEGSTEETQSPKRTAFHPITVGRIYSPTASPSASILKKRRLSDDSPSETNSPPAKQRRVSFATPLADVTRVDTERPPSPLVKMTGASLTPESVSLTQSGKIIETQSTQGSPSQKNYDSGQDAQTNNTDPVCPELMGCDQSVEKILPQLTSSIWSRGLGQLVRARNIRTIGDLSSLSEGDIHGLPIRSPKVDTVKKVLTKFGKNFGSTRPKRSSKVSLDSQLKSAEAKPEIKQPAEIMSTSTTGITDKVISEDVDALLADSGSLLDEVNNLADDADKFQIPEAPADKPESQSESTEPEPCAGASSKPNTNLTEVLLQYCDKNGIDVKDMSANDLVKMSQNLTAMLSEVNKAIEAVVNTRCRSPWR